MLLRAVATGLVIVITSVRGCGSECCTVVTTAVGRGFRVWTHEMSGSSGWAWDVSELEFVSANGIRLYPEAYVDSDHYDHSSFLPDRVRPTSQACPVGVLRDTFILLCLAAGGQG